MKKTQLLIFLSCAIWHQIANTNPTPILTEIAIGELVDKITILRIKKNRITDPKKLKNIITELTSLEKTFLQQCTNTPEIESLTDELMKINEQLWDIEDAIRDKERAKKFDAEFIQIARSVYFTNDKRCEIKRAINLILQSNFIEEKSYSDYTNATPTI